MPETPQTPGTPGSAQVANANANAEMPRGTVTFLFTDIEGSTKRWEENPRAMQAAFARQEAILRQAIAANQGHAYKMIGDAFQAAFPTAPQALQATIDAQRALQSEAWPPETGEVRVRMALHTGITEERGDDYVGPTLNRVARILSAAHGGQVLLSEVMFGLVRDGLPPGVQLLDMGDHRLKDLVRPQHIFQLVLPELPSQFPPLRTLDYRPNNLPIQPTPLIGREKELAAVGKLLRDQQARIITLTGPGGTGKTRLSLQAAAEAIDSFEDGVFFVALATITDPALVASSIAQAIGLAESGGKALLDALKEYLKDKQMLLVLDNFEQVIQAAPVAGQIVAAAPRVKALVTSREPLHLYGEMEFPVQPLQLPDPRHLPALDRLMQYEAVQLFIQRATGAKPDFQVTNDNAPAVAEICYRLDGLPLAIELAAARIKLLTPQAMLARLRSHGLSGSEGRPGRLGRLGLLVGGARDLPARQQTLRNAIDWSYRLLEEPEQIVFRRLAVFVGGAGMEAVEAVCLAPELGPEGEEIDALSVLGGLVDKSLLRPGEDKEGQVRFSMLQTIREYALDRLAEVGAAAGGELESIQRLHAGYYRDLAAEGERHLYSPRQRRWLDLLENENDNFRAALEWSIRSFDEGSEGSEGDLAIGLGIAGSLSDFWHIRGHLSEGSSWAEALEARLPSTRLDRTPEGTALVARLYYGLGHMAFVQNRAEQARDGMTRSLELYEQIGDLAHAALSMSGVGAMIAFTEGPAAGRPVIERSVALARAAGEKGKPYVNRLLLPLGVVLFLERQFEAARACFEEGLALSRQVGDNYNVTQMLNDLGDIARIERDYKRAGAFYREALPLYEAQGSKVELPAVLHNLGYVALAERDLQEAARLFAQSMRMQQEVGNQPGIAECLAGFAAVAAVAASGESGEADGLRRAAHLFGAAQEIRRSLGAFLWPAEQIECERNMGAARARANSDDWQAGWDEGRAMVQADGGLGRAIAYALGTPLS